MARLLGLLLIAASILLPGPAFATARVAFVVGVDRYDNLDAIQQLQKAVNDAGAMAEAFQTLGYRVTKAENTSRRDFLRQWQTFLNGLQPGDEAAFYFAGHGVEIDGQNFLLAGDVPKMAPGDEEVMKAEGLALSGLLDQVHDRHPQVSLFVIDACRDNPFFDARGRSVGSTRGLALVEPPRGTFIMFSASKNETALDRLSDGDPNPNSIFTRTLLPRLKAPGKITDIARDVRRQVVDTARGVSRVQVPAYYDEVVGDFCPAGCGAAVSGEAKTEPKQAPAAAPVQIAEREAPPEAEIRPTPAIPANPPAPPADDPSAASAAPPSDERAASGLAPLPGRLAALEEQPAPPIPAITPKQSTGKLRRLREMSLEDRFENCAAFSPDGTLLATGLDNGKVVIWDAATGKSLRTLDAEGGVLSVAFSPDGRFLISGETTETIRIWDPASGQLIRTVTNAATHVRSIALSPDGRTFATADAGKDIALWDVFTGARIGTLNPDETHLLVYSVAYSPDGMRLAAGTWTDVQLWNPATGALVWRSKTEDFARTETLAFSPDGSRMIAGDDLGRVRFIDTASGETLKTVKVPLPRKANVFDDDIHGLVWTPDGRMVIAATRAEIHLLDADGQVLKTVKHKLVGTIAISPAGDRLAVAGLGITIFEP